MRCEFFLFADGPWRGRIIDNPFEADGLLPATSLLVAGGSLRYVLTAGRSAFPNGGVGAIYQVDPSSIPPRGRSIERAGFGAGERQMS